MVFYKYFGVIFLCLMSKAVLAIDVVDEIDFGEQVAGKVVTREIEIRNTTKHNIKIKHLVSSCRCLQSEIDSFEIVSGDSVKLRVSLDSLGRQTKIKKVLTMITDENVETKYSIAVKGTFVAKDINLVAYPPHILAHSVCPPTFNAVIRIRRRGFVDVGEIRLASLSKKIKFKKLDDNATKKSIYYEVDIPINSNGVKFNDEIVVMGEDPNDFYRIPIELKIEPDIKIIPDKILVLPGKNSYALQVKQLSNEKLNLVKATLDSDMLFLEKAEYCQNTGKLFIAINQASGWQNFNKSELAIEFKGYEPLKSIYFVSPPRLPLPEMFQLH